MLRLVKSSDANKCTTNLVRIYRRASLSSSSLQWIRLRRAHDDVSYQWESLWNKKYCWSLISWGTLVNSTREFLFLRAMENAAAKYSSFLPCYSQRASINGGDVSIRLLIQNRPRDLVERSPICLCVYWAREKDRRIFHIRGDDDVDDEERKTRSWNEELFFFQLVV